MSKTFRPWDLDQQWILPPSLHEFVPPGHVAHFIRDTVCSELDLRAIMSAYDEERGFPPYHPAMMVSLLLYGYSRGVYSSRKLAQACEERVDFMAVTAMNRPDFRTIASFRRRHLQALGALFVQVLKLCRAAGLVKLGHVALDGTKIQANANVHKAMSYGRMRETEKKLAAEVSSWLRAPRRATPRRTTLMAASCAAMKCRIGPAIKSSAWSASAPRKRRWRPKPKHRRPMRTMDLARRRG
jgi:transposase